MAKEVSIVWFRRDLRVEDNPALVAAARLGAIVPIFIWSPEEEGRFYPGRVARWWLQESLGQLNAAIKALTSAPLLLRKAPCSISVLMEVAQATGATRLCYNHLYDPVSLVRDHQVKVGMEQAGIKVETFNADLLFEPWEVMGPTGEALTNFADFWSEFQQMPSLPALPLPAPSKPLLSLTGLVASAAVSELQLESGEEKASNELLGRAWLPGCQNADATFLSFLSSTLKMYSPQRKRVDVGGTSLLSPHLHFGEISARMVYHRVLQLRKTFSESQEPASAVSSCDRFLRSLGLRDFSRYICFNFPFTHNRSLMANLRHFPWRQDESLFKAWRMGRTGYPLIDAAMRELWATGWMHDSLRVLVATFCVKFLLLPWQWGMKYFWDTLVDADLETDVLGWQFISGSLPDSIPLDHLPSPVEVGRKVDKDGEYVRRWVPELSRVPCEFIHCPWNAPSRALSFAGVELGVNYPRPVVEEAAAKARLQEAIAGMVRRHLEEVAVRRDVRGRDEKWKEADGGRLKEGSGSESVRGEEQEVESRARPVIENSKVQLEVSAIPKDKLDGISQLSDQGKDKVEGRRVEDRVDGRRVEDRVDGRRVEDRVDGRRVEERVDGRRVEERVEDRRVEDRLVPMLPSRGAKEAAEAIKGEGRPAWVSVEELHDDRRRLVQSKVKVTVQDEVHEGMEQKADADVKQRKRRRPEINSAEDGGIKLFGRVLRTRHGGVLPDLNSGLFAAEKTTEANMSLISESGSCEIGGVKSKVDANDVQLSLPAWTRRGEALGESKLSLDVGVVPDRPSLFEKLTLSSRGQHLPRGEDQ